MTLVTTIHSPYGKASSLIAWATILRLPGFTTEVSTILVPLPGFLRLPSLITILNPSISVSWEYASSAGSFGSRSSPNCNLSLLLRVFLCEFILQHFLLRSKLYWRSTLGKTCRLSKCRCARPWCCLSTRRRLSPSASKAASPGWSRRCALSWRRSIIGIFGLADCSTSSRRFPCWA